ncbi:hypothetical protein [Spongiimicrobium salis]|uniref:hypothetical protein n=1 Tax=Spongiimicrobium salis TaxID=1667022 RepID=UPI00374D047F
MNEFICIDHGKTNTIIPSIKLEEYYLKDQKTDILKLRYKDIIPPDTVFFLSTKEELISKLKSYIHAYEADKFCQNLPIGLPICKHCFFEYIERHNITTTENVLKVK